MWSPRPSAFERACFKLYYKYFCFYESGALLGVIGQTKTHFGGQNLPGYTCITHVTEIKSSMLTREESLLHIARIRVIVVDTITTTKHNNTTN